MACHSRVKSSCGMYSVCGVMFRNFQRKEGLLLIPSSLYYFQNGGSHVRSLGQKAGTGCQRSYLLVDGWEQAIRGGHIL